MFSFLATVLSPRGQTLWKIRVVVKCEYFESWLTKHPEAHDVVVER